MGKGKIGQKSEEYDKMEEEKAEEKAEEKTEWRKKRRNEGKYIKGMGAWVAVMGVWYG